MCLTVSFLCVCYFGFVILGGCISVCLNVSLCVGVLHCFVCVCVILCDIVCVTVCDIVCVTVCDIVYFIMCVSCCVRVSLCVLVCEYVSL